MGGPHPAPAIAGRSSSAIAIGRTPAKAHDAGTDRGMRQGPPVVGRWRAASYRGVMSEEPLASEISEAAPVAPVPAAAPASFAVLRYTAARLALFVIAAGLLYLAGLRSILLLLVAVVLSGFVSYVLLDRTRDQAAASVGSVFSRWNARINASARAEDDDEPPVAEDSVTGRT